MLTARSACNVMDLPQRSTCSITWCYAPRAAGTTRLSTILLSRRVAPVTLSHRWACDGEELSMTVVNDLDVYRAVRDLIVGGTFRAGHRLVEADLSTALGAGRSYVRHALARLEFEGLVEKEPGHSATVRRVSKAEMLETVEARLALESIVARAAATRCTDTEAAGLTAVFRSLEAAAKASDISGLLDLQAEFHHAVLDASRLPTIRRLIHNLTALTAQTRVRSMLLPGRVPASVKEHRAIATAIAARDPDAAQNAMALHLRSVAHAIASLPDPSLRSGETTHHPATQEVTP
jgi:DNA-binding GntR family transcriptional regulator